MGRYQTRIPSFTTPTSAAAQITAPAQNRGTADPNSEQQRGLGGILTGGLTFPDWMSPAVHKENKGENRDKRGFDW